MNAFLWDLLCLLLMQTLDGRWEWRRLNTVQTLFSPSVGLPNLYYDLFARYCRCCSQANTHSLPWNWEDKSVKAGW